MNEGFTANSAILRKFWWWEEQERARNGDRHVFCDVLSDYDVDSPVEDGSPAETSEGGAETGPLLGVRGSTALTAHVLVHSDRPLARLYLVRNCQHGEV